MLDHVQRDTAVSEQTQGLPCCRRQSLGDRASTHGVVRWAVAHGVAGTPLTWWASWRKWHLNPLWRMSRRGAGRRRDCRTESQSEEAMWTKAFGWKETTHFSPFRPLQPEDEKRSGGGSWSGQVSRPQQKGHLPEGRGEWSVLRRADKWSTLCSHRPAQILVRSGDWKCPSLEAGQAADETGCPGSEEGSGPGRSVLFWPPPDSTAAPRLITELFIFCF